MALTVLIEYLIVTGQDVFVIFAHKSLCFRDESLLASDAVRAEDHQHRKRGLRLDGKLSGHAYRIADKLSLAS